MDFLSTLAAAREKYPSAYGIVKTQSGEFVACTNAATVREVIRLFGGALVKEA